MIPTIKAASNDSRKVMRNVAAENMLGGFQDK